MHGYATFPGVQFVRSADFTFSHGIGPSRCSLEIAPQGGNFARTGDLRLIFGYTTLLFRDCIVDYGASDFNRSGEIWRLYILDRRYKWAWGQISGAYNLRFSDGTLKTDTQKTPRELAELCLDAMGEKGGDVSALPTNVWPTVDWTGIPPAEALAELCDMFGCRVVLSLTDRVYVVKVGEGRQLPGGGVISNGCEVNPAELPGAVAIGTSPCRFQVDFELEAVGLDVNGAIKPIDNLSYAPANGWVFVPEGGHALNLPNTIKQELAELTVFRWYRVKEPIFVPGLNLTLQQRELILPLLSNQCETMEQEAADGTKILIDRPAAVYGVYKPSDDADENSAESLLPADRNTVGDSEVKRSFSLDAERGIVMFSEPIYKLGAGAGFPQQYAAADLRLRTSCHARYPGPEHARALARLSVWRNIGSSSDPTRYVDRTDVVPRYIPIYQGAGFRVSRVVDNTKDVRAECNHYLDQIIAEYQTPSGQTVEYAGLLPVELDGAIQQVTWSIALSGTTTTASRNSEQRAKSLPYVRRREAERARAAVRAKGEAPRLPFVGRWNNVTGRFEG